MFEFHRQKAKAIKKKDQAQGQRQHRKDIPDSSLGGRAATRKEGPGKVLCKGRRPIRQPPLV